MREGEGFPRATDIRAVRDIVRMGDKDSARFVGPPSYSLRLWILRNVNRRRFRDDVLEEAVQELSAVLN